LTIYIHNRENLDPNAVNHLSYDEKAENKSGMVGACNDLR
jgi:hypothetical protein